MKRRWSINHLFYQRGRELKVQLHERKELLFGVAEKEIREVNGDDEMWFDRIHREVGLIND